MRAAVMGEPALLQLSTKSCRRRAACRACCSIRGASVSARQHMSVSTLQQRPNYSGQIALCAAHTASPQALTADNASPLPASLYLH